MGTFAPLRLGTFFALTSSAGAVIFGVDGFDYPDGPVAGQTGGVSWDRTNAAFFSPSGGPSTWDNISGAPTVSLGRLVTNNSSAKREYKGSPEADGAVNDGAFAKAVYYRTTMATGPTLPNFFGMSSYDFGAERLFFGKRFGAAHFGLVNSITGAFNDSSIPVQPNTTYVLVARVDYAAAADTIRLYVNPDLTAAEPATASASLPWTHTEWSTAVRLASGNTGSPVIWDDITVATAWSDLALVVKSAADVDHGGLGDSAQSLRDCLKYGAKGSTILFAPLLNGQTISLGSEIAVTSTSLVGDFIVDASALTNGITINDGAATTYRLLHVNSGARLEVRGVTFANAGAPSASIDGGAARNSGTLTLTRCTLSGNAAGNGNGGAVYSSGSLLVNQCTFSGNSAASGGALESLGDSRLVHCTLAENTALASGGGMRNSQGNTTLLHCTLAENTAGTSGGGVASAGDGPATTVVRHSVISGNAGGDVEFIGGALNSFTSQGRNLIGTGNATGDFNQAGDLINNLDPLLSPFGSYGGRTKTMPPLAGSPAIDAAAAIANVDADQRGFARNRDGNNDGNFSQDIGAVEAAFRFVTSDLDSGAGTLRQALLDAAATPGWEAIAFDSSLDGGTISLTSFAGESAITISDAAGVSIDATSLDNGLTITKPAGGYRLIRVSSGRSLALHRLTLTNGGPVLDDGGAVVNAGTLTLTECILSGNATSGVGAGGAIFNSGTLALARCTLSDNSAASGGGAIYHWPSSGTATFTRCTFSGNRAGSIGGGAIYNRGSLTLNQCTISANGRTSGGDGGGIVNFFDTQLTLSNTIVAGNAASSSADISNLGTITRLGTNLVQSPAGGTIDGTGTILSADPKLAPLGHFGGYTQTMPPRPGSPAIDAASGAFPAADQRGFPRLRDGDGNGAAIADIGAVEASIFVVTKNDDSGAGSLRQAIADAAVLPGADTIVFSQSLDGGTISLDTFASGTALTVNDADGVTIDASTLTNGLTITKPAGNYRLFRVNSPASLTLDSLTLKGGTSAGGSAVFNFATVVLTRCTLLQNSGSATAGAVLNAGILTLDRCTLSDNTGVRGGGLLNDTGATANVVNCTFTANSASDLGGGIFNDGALFLRHATIVENSAASDAGGVSNGGTLRLGNTIVAGNFVGVPTARNDLRVGFGSLATDGGNLIGVNGFILAGVFPAGLPNGNGDFVGSDASPLDPRLQPLGNYGGPTQTMPPLAGSRAIDAGINFGLDTIDQRGKSRIEDGDNNGIARPDSGAVEAAFRFVTDPGDSGPGTLRQALADAAAAPGWEAIAFSSALNGGTISLTTSANTTGLGQSALEVRDRGGAAIDATSLPDGLTITKPVGAYRLFAVAADARLSLHQLTLTGGNIPNGIGGAIRSGFGTVNLSDCTLTGNLAFEGGAICSQSGSFSSGKVTELHRCTITGNTATNGAGTAIRNLFGRMVVAFSTIADNSATGSGIAGNGTTDTETVVTSSIISGYTGGDVVFMNGATNSFTSQGHNLIGTGNATGAFKQTGDIINNLDPLLAPLGDHGGPTRTMPPLAGSLAIDAGGSIDPGGTDQRGFARFVDGDGAGGAQLDIGAVEAGPLVTVTTAVDEDNGTGSGSLSLREALGLATTPGHRIQFSNAIFPGGAITLGGTELSIPAAARIFIDGSNLPAPVTISGNNVSRVFNIAVGATVAMQNLVITGGRSPDAADGGDLGVSGANGGGILNGGSLTLLSCRVAGNRTGRGGNGGISGGDGGSGGGVFSSGLLQLAACEVSSNFTGNGGSGDFAGTGGAGGGISGSGSLSSLSLTSSSITDNHTGNGGAGGSRGGSGGSGGGIASGSLNLTSCTITGNFTGSGGSGSDSGAGGAGGGLNTTSAAIIRATVFSGNAAEKGGAIFAAPVFLNHCTLSGNSAVNGGGIHSVFAELEHTTVSGNRATGQGGGVVYLAQNGSSLVLKNSIVAGNTAATSGPDIARFNPGFPNITAGGANLVGELSSAGAIDGPAPLTGDARLMPLGNYGGPTQSMPPLAGSPAVDAGATTSAHATDQRGFPRVVDGNNAGGAQVDLGAVEAAFRVVTTADDSGAGSLRQALADAVATPGFEAIAFAQALDGGTIALADSGGSGQALSVGDGDGVTVDASRLSLGLTITKPAGSYRLIRVNAGGRLSLHHLTLTGGSVGAGQDGGAISNAGAVLLTRCTLTGNSADFGGAIENNSSSDFVNHGTTLLHCTLAGNHSTGQFGGTIYNAAGRTTLAHCTVSGNTTASGIGGVSSPGSGMVRTEVENSIIAGNAGSDVALAFSTVNKFVSLGHNLIGDGNATAAFNQTGDIRDVTDPLLSPLAPRGGPTQTMPPLPGSLAIGGALGSTAPADQRGFAIVGTADIGAVERGPIFTVTNNGDPGAGSLRDILAAAAAVSDARIVFDSALDGETITLSDPLFIPSTQNVEIDATSLRAGLTISGGGGRRVFYSDGILSLHRLAIRNGSTNEPGAGIYSTGPLLAVDCTLAGNVTTSVGGGIFNGASVSNLLRCAISNNTAGGAGGFWGFGTLTQCTIAGNRATGSVGTGGIIPFGTIMLRHCTITQNEGSGGGGGIIVENFSVHLERSIIAGNTDSAGCADICRINVSPIAVGPNLIGSNATVEAQFPAGPLVGTPSALLDPLLAPLDNYGGPTKTLALKPGSPARDAAVGSLATRDQRGFPIVGVPDLGAYEAGTITHFPTFIWETLPDTASEAEHAATFDYDNDGSPNGDEWLALTNPSIPGSVFLPTSTVNGTDLIITFPTVVGRTYTLVRTDSLDAASWSTNGLPPPIIGDGTIHSFTVSLSALSRRFFRVVAGL